MSAYLVDTHALLWFLTDDPQLSPEAKRVMEAADSELFVSTASYWEIAIKSGLGKLDVPEDLIELVREQGFEVLGIASEHAWAVRSLPAYDHRDPFDRLLVAQASLEALSMISADARFDAYGVDRLW